MSKSTKSVMEVALITMASRVSHSSSLGQPNQNSLRAKASSNCIHAMGLKLITVASRVSHGSSVDQPDQHSLRAKVSSNCIHAMGLK
jgi:acid stress-induced BolA-like protein IbaG/YrbA